MTQLAIHIDTIDSAFDASKFYKDRVKEYSVKPVTFRYFYPAKYLYNEGVSLFNKQMGLYEEMLDKIIEVSPKDAKDIYRTMNKSTNSLIKENKKLMSVLIKRDLFDDGLKLLFDEMIKKMEDFLKITKIISESQNVDEDNQNYVDFVSKIVADSRLLSKKTGDSFVELIS